MSAELLTEDEMAVLLQAIAAHGSESDLLAECSLPFDSNSRPAPTPARTRSRRPAPSSEDSSDDEVRACLLVGLSACAAALRPAATHAVLHCPVESLRCIAGRVAPIL